MGDDCANAGLADLLKKLDLRCTRGEPATPLPEDYAVARQVAEGASTADLVERFEQAATTAGMIVRKASDVDWLQAVVETLRAASAGSVVVPPAGDDFFSAERRTRLIASLCEADVKVLEQHDDDTLFAAAAAIGGVHCAIAETGSLVCVAGARHSRGATLIPPVHVAVVAASQLRGDLLDAFADSPNGPNAAASVSLITGPSKTADIEGVLVTGVHGPGAVHIVLVGG